MLLLILLFLLLLFLLPLIPFLYCLFTYWPVAVIVLALLFAFILTLILCQANAAGKQTQDDKIEITVRIMDKDD